MYAVLLQVGSWLGRKLVGVVLIVVIALAAYGIWSYLQEAGRLEEHRLERLQQALADREKLQAAKAAVAERVAALQREVEAQKERVERAGKVLAALRELESWWDRLWGNSAQQRANAEQAQRMVSVQKEAQLKLAERQSALALAVAEKFGVEAALHRADQEVGRLAESRSQVARYLWQAWQHLKWWLAFAVMAFLLGPTIWALFLYYAVAPWLSRGRPIRLGGEPAALPEVGESRVSIEATLRPGEVMRLKERFLQASDEGVGKRTRFVLDWSIPFTSLACGLVELVELRPEGAAGEWRVTLSSSDDPHAELSITTIPAGGSLVLRPSFLAGVIQRQDEPLHIRRHWRLLHWQAWISGQFRFFEFIGPCRLVITGSRGVRAERLADREGQAAPARRTNQDATIGFTPNLDYRPVRAETFWGYFRGMNPLFDDLFSGRGVFVVQETSTEGPAAKAGAFWSSVWSGVLKVFGL
ncbi:MAG: hypothetical protein HZC55_21785 [Verrucomicrobia bacterium]|nr:hypothetical protein [Verrucomicrobiota bacterium]